MRFKGEIRIFPENGTSVFDAITFAVSTSKRTGMRVNFDFNGTPAHAEPGEEQGAVYDRWTKIRAQLQRGDQ